MRLYVRSLFAALCAIKHVTAFLVCGPKTVDFSCHASSGFLEGTPETRAGPTSPFEPVPSGGPRGVAAGLADNGQTRAARTDVWDTSAGVTVQGGSLRTWSFASMAVERVQILMQTDGRPLNADLELWHGPDNTPQKLAVYVEDGSMRQFRTVVETPHGSNTIAIRNTSEMAFPLAAAVLAKQEMGSDIRPLEERMPDLSGLQIVQGGAVKTYPFDPTVTSVQVFITTDGRPLNARIELLQGPNNNKQVVELYAEDGIDRPFYGVFETPGIGNVVRIVNTATVEFPLSACVEPFEVFDEE